MWVLIYSRIDGIFKFLRVIHVYRYNMYIPMCMYLDSGKKKQWLKIVTNSCLYIAVSPRQL